VRVRQTRPAGGRGHAPGTREHRRWQVILALTVVAMWAAICWAAGNKEDVE